MLLSASHPFTTVYRVEVSGWDTRQSFFVEKSELEWNEETGKHILLSHALPEGARIFVRLLQTASQERSVPVAYQVKFAGEAADGRKHFVVKQAQPRTKDCGETIR